MLLKNVSLEMSPKPLFRKDDDSVLAVFRSMFRDWQSLLRHAEQVSFLWWLSDGSDLLVWNRDWEAPIEWMFWQGFAHPTYDVPLEQDPQRDSIVATPRLYHPDAITLNAADVRRIIGLIRQAGQEVLGCSVRVGMAFDPGAEFSNHPFRYQDHPELLMGAVMKCIDCTARFEADPRPFAGFPDGIPAGLPFGRFFGRQARLYLDDLGFDYLWLSNSFGFGRSPYASGSIGDFFNGREFTPQGNLKVHDDILEFWQLLREEMQGREIECRGTDFTVGMNYVNHATPYPGMYDHALAVPPPPNTPWPALTRNHGIAIAGYLTHIAAAGGDLLPMRFYVSDPWFCNAPWLDRWHRNPHDIYLSGAVARVSPEGRVEAFNDVKFLSVDTSWGEVPEVFPDEIIPHIKRATAMRPDAVSPLLWVYPLREYHGYTFTDSSRIAEVLAGDLLIQQAINDGLPVSTVIATEIFVKLTSDDPARFRGQVLLTPVPLAGSAWEKALTSHLRSGGRVLLYGSTDHAGAEWRQLLGLQTETALDGEFQLEFDPQGIARPEPAPTLTCLHNPALSGGGVSEIAAADVAGLKVLARMHQGGRSRIAASVRSLPEWRGGQLAWVRGTSSIDGQNVHRWSLATLPVTEFYPTERILRLALAELGWQVGIERTEATNESVHLMLTRHRNGFVLAGFSPDSEAALVLRTPLGVPVMPRRTVCLKDGSLRWPVWHWFHEECRVFVEQQEGRLSLLPISPKHAIYRKRWQLTGLCNATVRFFPEAGCEKHTDVLVNGSPNYCIVGEESDRAWVETPWGRCLELRGITGQVMFAWAPDDVVIPVKPAEATRWPV